MGLRQPTLENMVNRLAGKNILVTGGTGFIGSHIVEELIKYNAKIIVTFLKTDPKSYFFFNNLDKKTIPVKIDVSNYKEVKNLITKFQINYIFHLAAQPLVEVAYEDPLSTFQSNIIGTINILECSRLNPKIKGVIVASSDKAYGQLNKKKYSEEDPLEGIHPYEVSKSAADLICQAYFKTYQIPVVISRFGNVYGEGDLNFSRIFPGVMKSIVKKEALELRSNGKYVRDYIYVKDVITGYMLLASHIDKIKGQAFNFGSKETLSVLELISLIEKLLNKKVDRIILNKAKNEITYQSLDYTKAKRVLGWEPKWDIKSAIYRIYDYYNQIF